MENGEDSQEEKAAHKQRVWLYATPNARGAPPIWREAAKYLFRDDRHSFVGIRDREPASILMVIIEPAAIIRTIKHHGHGLRMHGADGRVRLARQE